jgi:MFS family permease
LQVAQFLGLTMLPFAIVAPLVGPFLDRFSHGRRWAIGATMALRAFLCWVLADAVVTGSVALFPAALGCLVASKAYGVTRAAAVPRLLPRRLTLVKANSRISLAGVAGAALSAPLAVLASTFGPEWSLRYAFAVVVGATVLAILLPAAWTPRRGGRCLPHGRIRTSWWSPCATTRACGCSRGSDHAMAFLLGRAVPRLRGPTRAALVWWWARPAREARSASLASLLRSVPRPVTVVARSWRTRSSRCGCGVLRLPTAVLRPHGRARQSPAISSTP